MSNNYFKMMFRIIVLVQVFFSVKSFGQNIPELMYYKFDATGNQANSASSPVGTNPSTFAGTGLTISTPAQFNTALSGAGVASTNYLNTAWATNLVSTPWTMSFWIN